MFNAVADLEGLSDRPDEDQVVAELRRILNPRAVAIVGASNTPGKFGYAFTRAFLEVGFEHVYAVNPREREVLGLPAYPTAQKVPDEIDLAYIVTPAGVVLAAVEDCGAKGIRGIVIPSSGFAEAGPDGAALQRQIVAAARRHGSRIIGPNCFGIFSPRRRLPFLVQGMPTEDGTIAMISHSGSFCEYLAKAAHSKGLHFDTVVSIGNEADLNALDFLAYFGADPAISIVVCYLEGIKDGRRFLRLARAISGQKPIIVLKGGMTEDGSRAAGSHTGALAGAGRVWQAAFQQAGVFAPNGFEALLDTLFACARLPHPRGPRIAIVSGPGGPAVLAADACVEEGLALARLNPETRDKLATLIPAVGTSVANPIDLGTTTINDPGIYRPVIEVVASDENVDAILAIGTDDLRCAQTMIDVRPHLDKPLLVTGLMPPEAAPDWYERQTRSGVAVYSDARRAAATVARLLACTHGTITATGTPSRGPAESESARALIAGALRLGRHRLSEHEANEVLRAYGVPVTEERVVGTHEELTAALKALKWPVALKIDSPDILHKTEAGLVELNCRSAREAEAAFHRLLKRSANRYPLAQINGVLVQEMVTGGTECIVGVKKDAQFGPIVMFGLGGIFVEVFADVALRIAPLGEADLEAMVTGIKGYPVLAGARGRAKADIAAIKDVLLHVSALALDLEDSIAEIDINPLMVRADGLGAMAVDALLLLNREPPGEGVGC